MKHDEEPPEPGNPAGAGREHLDGGGRMGAALRAHDWARSELGSPQAWPHSLKTLTRIILSSAYPSFVWWGPRLISLNNDAYLPVLGTKHPDSVAAPAQEIWSEIWDVVGPLAERVMKGGESVWFERLQLLMNRRGYLEETYFTFSYSPATDDDGVTAGVYCTCFDDTAAVLGERRLATLRTLAASLVEVRNQEDACAVSIEALSGNPQDLPFAAIYLGDGNQHGLRRLAMAGLPSGSSLCPPEIAPEHRFDLRAGEVLDLSSWSAELAGCGPWDDPPLQAVSIPIGVPGREPADGFLVAGLSPRRAFDDDYRGLLELVARSISAGLATARASEEERRRAAALAEIDREKTLFFNDVSHEFRTPLTLMLGPLQDVLAHPDARMGRAETELVHRNALRLLKLVNTLLDFSRIEAGRAEAVYEATDLSSFTTELASVFRSAAQRAGLEFDVACAPLGEPIYVDRDMWEKVVLNLLSNALKFTFSGGIRVALRDAGERVELLVQDTGTGIEPGELENVFKRFHRVRSARSRTHEGSGIGLALVKELVRLHQGVIEVESESGRGSCFRVQLPKGMAHLPAEQIALGRARATTALGAAAFVEEALRWLPSTHRVEGRLEPARDDEPGIRSPYLGPHASDRCWRILLVDDNADMRDYLSSLLAGYEVHAVADGLQALEAAGSGNFDLILSDVMLPGIDGLELTRRLRGDPRTRDLPVVLLSARAGEEARVDGLTAGADIYLPKPFSGRELLAHVAGALRLSALRSEVAEEYRLADRRKDEFLAVLGHELRNPLAALTTATDLLVHGGEDDHRYAQSILSRNVRSLVRMVDDLVEISRLTLGKVTLKREPLCLAQLTREVVETVEIELAQPSPTLSFSAPERVPVDGDPVRLAQVVSNLINNAMNYSSPEGEVRVRVHRHAGRAVLEVQDTGIGLHEEEVGTIFEPFWQPAGLQRSGLGIGLAIVKQFVELHDGQVSAASDGPGTGSVFTVSLPIRETPSAGPRDAELQTPASQPLAGRRLLVIDDNRDAADGLARLMGRLGAEVRVAYDGSSGLQAAGNADVIILDIGLPDIEGTEVAARIRRLPNGASIFLVAATGYGDVTTARRIEEAGFDAHLLKPVDHRVLEQLLQRGTPS